MEENNIETDWKHCKLCPRKCGADRTKETVFVRCHEPSEIYIARAALHMWEEPCISGKEGSGAVFFSGCSLGCVYCQNGRIADGQLGKKVSENRLTQIYLELQEQGANNINLVTAAHYLPQVLCTVSEARSQGLSIPIVYNTSSYETTQAIDSLRNTVDIYLPDLKYITPELAALYSHAPDYPKTAMAAIERMAEQVKEAEFDSRGIMKRGVIVRHLILPGHVSESKKVIKYLYETYGNSIYISIMNQYTPMEGIEKKYPELGRRVTRREYDRVVDYALTLGLENGFIQEGKTSKESFIPDFDTTGV